MGDDGNVTCAGLCKPPYEAEALEIMQLMQVDDSNDGGCNLHMGHYNSDSLHVLFRDFAYEDNGSFRMAHSNIGEATAKSFAA